MIKKAIVVAVLLGSSAAPALAGGMGAIRSAGNGYSYLAGVACSVYIPFDDRLPDGAVEAGAGRLYRPCIGI
jgi:hypothetical protein